MAEQHLAALGVKERTRDHAERAWGVQAWPVDAEDALQRPPRPEGAPPWWHGQEEASQVFLAAVGER